MDDWRTSPLPGVVNDPNVKAQKTNGVARSAFARPASRRAKWHRPYIFCLVIADLLCAIASSYTAVSIFAQDRIQAGFTDDRVFLFIAYVGLPLGWLILLWSNGAYDRRIIGIGQTSSSGSCARPSRWWLASVFSPSDCSAAYPAARWPSSRWARWPTS
jgi:hypothetical protein